MAHANESVSLPTSHSVWVLRDLWNAIILFLSAYLMGWSNGLISTIHDQINDTIGIFVPTSNSLINQIITYLLCKLSTNFSRVTSSSSTKSWTPTSLCWFILFCCFLVYIQTWMWILFAKFAIVLFSLWMKLKDWKALLMNIDWFSIPKTKYFFSSTLLFQFYTFQWYA